RHLRGLQDPGGAARDVQDAARPDAQDLGRHGEEPVGEVGHGGDLQADHGCDQDVAAEFWLLVLIGALLTTKEWRRAAPLRPFTPRTSATTRVRNAPRIVAITPSRFEPATARNAAKWPVRDCSPCPARRRHAGVGTNAPVPG